MPDLAPFIVTERSFDATGTLREEGSVGYYEPTTLEDHLIPIADLEVPRMAIAAVGPTGPNPRVPQQIPPDAFQLPDGYGQPLSRLVPETVIVPEQPEEPPPITLSATPPEEAAAQIEALQEAIKAKAEEVAKEKDEEPDLSGKSDKELKALRDKEVNKSKPRRNVIRAIDAALEAKDENGRPKPTQMPAK
jgi:hypothetical protein